MYDNISWSLPRLENVAADEHLARHVRRLDIGMATRVAGAVETEYVERMRDNLCGILKRLTSLHTLVVVVMSVNPARRLGFTRTVVAALQAVQLPKLTEFDLHLAFQGDLEYIVKGPQATALISITDICSRLKHLALGAERGTSSLSGDGHNNQPGNAARPIVPGTGHLRTLVEASSHLESLAIDVQNTLDIDGWVFSPRLAALRLRRVEASPATLSSLFSRAGGLRYVELRRVKLKYGQWSQILEALHASSSSCLVELYMRKCRHQKLGTGPDDEAERKKRREDAIAVFTILQATLSENRYNLRLPPVDRAENFIENAITID
ncbi:hypothetical protein NLG97_g8507 [Lecanicillium saksenae]|uniref:Uncharacterized protein n=1 Tax=Lecanicillium saksenae TaxID=468837 RepID=A0ACC1QKN5_9HYPO|nr:hypothetical protein NLG97_g8507 [Lecanicillium saksenae]